MDDDQFVRKQPTHGRLWPAIKIGKNYFIPLEEPIVLELKIDNNCYFVQEVRNDEIHLRLVRRGEHGYE